MEFIIKEGDEHLTSHSGLALIGALMNRTELGARVDTITLPGCREPKIPHGDIVKSMVGLLCMGKPDYNAIEEFRDAPFFCHSLGIGQCPASPTLRHLKIAQEKGKKEFPRESKTVWRGIRIEKLMVFPNHCGLFSM